VHQNWSGRCGEETNTLSLHGIEPWSFSQLPLTMPTEPNVLHRGKKSLRHKRVAVDWEIFLLRIRDVLGSNLVQEVDYPY
jgi:hypothetical protein